MIKLFSFLLFFFLVSPRVTLSQVGDPFQDQAGPFTETFTEEQEDFWHTLSAQKALQLQEYLQAIRTTSTSQYFTPPKKQADLSNVRNTPWRNAGPYNLAGQAWGVAADINNDSILLAGFAHGTIWRSTNQGHTWMRVTPLEDPLGSYEFEQDPRPGKQHIWYSIFSSILAKSEDNGKSWKRMEMPLGFQHGNHVRVDPSRTDSSIVYVSCIQGILRSNDGGLSWTTVLPNPANTGDIEVSKKGICYAYISNGPNYGFWRSTNGLSWKQITKNFQYISSTVQDLELAPSDERILYVYENHKSTDAKRVWRYIDNDNEADRWKLLYNGAFNTYSHFCTGFAVKPDDPTYLVAGGVLLQRLRITNDTILQAEPIAGTTTGSHADLHSIAFSPRDPNRLFIGTDGGVHVSHDVRESLVKWTDLARGMYTSLCNGIAIDQAVPGSERMAIGLWDNSNFMTHLSDSLTPWILIGGGDGGMAAISNGGQFYYTQDYGSSITRWELDTLTGEKETVLIKPYVAVKMLPMNQPVSNSGVFHAYHIDPSDNRFMYIAGGSVLLRTDDAAVEWSYPFPKVEWEVLSNAGSANISTVGISGEPPHIGYYTSDSGIYRLENLHTGYDKPEQLLGVEYNNGRLFNPATHVAVDRTNDSAVMVVYSSEILATTDRGATWQSIVGNIRGFYNGYTPGLAIPAILKTGNERIFFVGTNAGLFSTRELKGDSTVWRLESPDMIGPASVSWIDVRPSDGFVAVSTWGRGIYTSWFYEEQPAQNVNAEARNELKVSADPNPAQEEITVRFVHPNGGIARIEVIDLQGKIVATPYESWLGQGSQTLRLNIADLEQGAYTLQVRSKEYIGRSKLLIVR